MPLLGLIGDPISHSVSPLIHTLTARRLGLDLSYVTVHVRSSGAVGSVMRALHELGFAGLNVTIPYKEEAAKHAVSLSEDSALIGAVNALKRSDDGWEGHNTDYVAIREAVAERSIGSGFDALVIGAGGSARAAVAALIALGAGSVSIANRTLAKAQELVERFRTLGESRLAAVPLEKAKEAAKGSQVVVNTIPVGLVEGAELPIGPEDLKDGALLVDLVYGPRGSPMSRLASARGLELVDGVEVLARQAAASFRLWTGAEVGYKWMEAIGRFALRRSVGWERSH
ncbi:MAG: shikimate dehydrogenase [Thaumarchaeota archaeon]|nr:shikimate dehydrogenase [Candidatus Calditenuaceae archaeon]MCX8203439.1 shikimate dehydrogenase [Nitrososphaeria archaeon]MDW8043026.1 shikimate dehydrogenase [Nitrososphaerota archaeon]